LGITKQKKITSTKVLNICSMCDITGCQPNHESHSLYNVTWSSKLCRPCT